MTALDALVQSLQRALDLSVTTGTISLCLHEGRLQSVKTETYQRVTVDTPVRTGAILSR